MRHRPAGDTFTNRTGGSACPRRVAALLAACGLCVALVPVATAQDSAPPTSTGEAGPAGGGDTAQPETTPAAGDTAAPAAPAEGAEAAASPAPEGVSEEKPPEPEPLDGPFTPVNPVLGYAGDSPFELKPNVLPRETVPLPDRWRIGWVPWDRYGRQAPSDDVFMNAKGGDSPFTLGHPLNPYDRNVLKGDYPVFGQDIFFNFGATSDTFVQHRQLPTPSGVSAANNGSFDTFRDGKQTFFSQTVVMTFDLFKGNTAYRPVDWLLRVSPAFNYNYLNVEEFNVVNIDVNRGDERSDEHFALQEAFFEYHLGDVSPNFDFAALKLGRQLFVSDFRGFIYNDISDGARLFGNFASNRIQYNFYAANQAEKDTNSELNELNWREQQVVIANLYVQDFIWLGYTTQFSFHWNHDRSNERYDENGFLVRPDLAGSVTLQDLDALYLGWASDGHIGRLNVNHAVYYAFGEATDSPIAGRDVDISAYMAALELSMDFDWFRPKVSALYLSGDDDPTDGTAGGFDGILENPFFAGGPSSFYQSLPLRLFGVGLTQGRSFYNDLSSSKAEGQSNFVNPGTIVLNAGFDAEITPKLRGSFNVNSIFFAETETLEYFTNQNDIDAHVGNEANMAIQYRPLLNNNIIISVGGSVFLPAQGFEDIYDDEQTLYQVFGALTLTY